MIFFYFNFFRHLRLRHQLAIDAYERNSSGGGGGGRGGRGGGRGGGGRGGGVGPQKEFFLNLLFSASSSKTPDTSLKLVHTKETAQEEEEEEEDEEEEEWAHKRNFF